ncbi:MAG TPA: ATP-binding protein [Gemmatimonadaceae bacterium]|nr:ATP-binding protein [Gemmatimonadaceae bacterium]
MTIRSKLALGLFLIAVALLVPLLFTLRSLERLHDATVELRDREFAATLLLSRMRVAVDDARRAETALLFVHDSASLETSREGIVALRARADSLSAFDLDSAAVGLRAAIDTIAAYIPLEFELAARGDLRADSVSAQHVVPSIAATERTLEEAERALRVRTSDRVREAAELTATARSRAGLALAAALLIALVIAIIVWRTISRPVRDLEEGMAAVASGNFRYRLSRNTEHRSDEFGRLAASFRTMQDQLTQLDRMKAEFVSVASHELKTPINVILGYLQLLEEETYGAISAKQREVLETLESQTRALSRLVHHLLDVSRFEAGGGRLDLRSIELEGFLQDLEHAFRVLSMQRGIDFRVERGGELPVDVTWDPDRVAEVLGNLLSNAFKFTGRGGTIELIVHGSRGGDELSLMVRDTGSGIPAQDLPRIFDKFYQAHGPEGGDGSGAGLGLAIAKEIVSAHGGEIDVESTVGVGTTFRIHLPRTAGMMVRGGEPAGVGAHA